MINLKFEEKTYSIKNNIDEITVGEYEDISKIMKDNELDDIDKWIETFKYLGLPEIVCKNLDIVDLNILSSQYLLLFNNNGIKKIKKHIFINNEKINFVNKDIKIKIKDMILIQDIINSKDYISELITILYPKQIDKKIYIKEIKNNLTIDNALPIINYLNKNINNES